jgi:hypothetical protein
VVTRARRASRDPPSRPCTRATIFSASNSNPPSSSETGSGSDPSTCALPLVSPPWRRSPRAGRPVVQVVRSEHVVGPPSGTRNAWRSPRPVVLPKDHRPQKSDREGATRMPSGHHPATALGPMSSRVWVPEGTGHRASSMRAEALKSLTRRELRDGSHEGGQICSATSQDGYVSRRRISALLMRRRIDAKEIRSSPGPPERCRRQSEI